MIGKKVTDFHRPATGDTTFSLSDHKGKPVVLYFYPKDNTPGCTAEGAEFRDLHKRFAKAGAGSSACRATAQVARGIQGEDGLSVRADLRRRREAVRAVRRDQDEEHVRQAGARHRAQHFRDRTRRQAREGVAWRQGPAAMWPRCLPPSRRCDPRSRASCRRRWRGHRARRLRSRRIESALDRRRTGTRRRAGRALRPRRRERNDGRASRFSRGGALCGRHSFGVPGGLRTNSRSSLCIGISTRLLDGTRRQLTGVSGGSFTALAYGLYGDKLFEDYEHALPQARRRGRSSSRACSSPANWGEAGVARVGTLGDGREALRRGPVRRRDVRRPRRAARGPLILATATDISTGSRLGFTQADFDLLCSDLYSVPLSRAAAASSAVPLVLSPVTLNNYGGTCGFQFPAWTTRFRDTDNPARPASARGATHEGDASVPGQRQPAVPASRRRRACRQPGPAQRARGAGDARERSRDAAAARVSTTCAASSIFIVNSLSVPKTDWDKSPSPPSNLSILLKATGVPIDRYSYEAVELLKDMIARWRTACERLRRVGRLSRGSNNPELPRAAFHPEHRQPWRCRGLDCGAHSVRAQRDYPIRRLTRFAPPCR